jgi:hypothetical protein
MPLHIAAKADNSLSIDAGGVRRTSARVSGEVVATGLWPVFVDAAQRRGYTK